MNHQLAGDCWVQSFGLGSQRGQRCRAARDAFHVIFAESAHNALNPFTEFL
jgi:hypothetical protein